MRTQGVECPECGGMFTRVQNSNLDIEGNRVRARTCEDCKHLFSTVEVAVPGLSWARTQRPKAGGNSVIFQPQHLRLKVNRQSLTIYVEGPYSLCRAGKHRWTPKNTGLRRGGRYCRACSNEAARAAYHNARAKAPDSILEDQRAYWREQYRKRRAA